MDAPKLEIVRTQKDGKPAIELVVRNATAAMRPILDALGIVPTVDIANRRSIICTTPQELDAARAPIIKFFDHQQR